MTNTLCVCVCVFCLKVRKSTSILRSVMYLDAIIRLQHFGRSIKHSKIH